MGIFYQDNPALGHAGEGIAGIDDLRRGGLARLIGGVIEFSQLREQDIYYRALRSFYEISLIPVEEIERSGLAPSQFPL
jgi:hypothetical protein